LNEKLKWPPGLNRQVFLLGLVSLFADVSSEMLTPVTPLFLTVVLGATPLNLGVIEGLAQATASLMKTPAGRWSDLLGRRKPFVVMGYLMAALAKPLTGFAYNWPQILAARMAERFGKGLREAPRDALLADSVNFEVRARAYGWHRAMDTTGAVIGALLAIVLMWALSGNLRQVYFFALIPGLCAVSVALLINDVVKKDRSVDETVSSVKTDLPSSFRLYLGAWAVFCIGNSSDAFLVLRAHLAGFSMIQTIVIYSVYNMVYALASPFLGHVADQWGRRQIVVSGLLVFSFVYGGFAWMAAPPWVVIALFAIYGLYSAATDGVGRALATELLPEGMRAYGLGWIGTVTGVGALIASITAGLIWESWGPAAAFVFGSVSAAVSAFAISVVLARSEQPES
jgi:MFS family permease